jgi:hypothetical protein
MDELGVFSLSQTRNMNHSPSTSNFDVQRIVVLEASLVSIIAHPSSRVPPNSGNPTIFDCCTTQKYIHNARPSTQIASKLKACNPDLFLSFSPLLERLGISVFLGSLFLL